MAAIRVDRAQVIELAQSQPGLSQREIAKQIGCAQSLVSDILKEARGLAVTHASSHRDPPEGYVVRGVSSLVDDTGAVRLQWVKTQIDPEKQRQMFEAACKAAAEQIERVAPLPAPNAALIAPELLNLYTITDAHVGMYAWGRETGADWDLTIAEKTITEVFTRMIEWSPNARVGVINQMGDFLHTDSFKPLTPASGHMLDADSRYQKMVEVSVRILRKLIDVALQKHEIVHVNMLDANHDPVGGVWLRVLFSHLYANEPRVKVDVSPSPFVALQHGKVMLAAHHGHTVKNQNLPLLFATRFAEMWGATEYRYCHTGHLHHVEEKEFPGMIVTRHPTVTAPDAYSARNGFDSMRAASAIFYHAKYGQVGRHTLVPEMFG